MDKFIFQHIPKSAGTSLRFSILNSNPDYLIAPQPSQISELRGIYTNFQFLHQSFPEYHQYPLIFGHYRANNIYPKVFNRRKKISIIREPIKRELSHLKTLQFKANISFDEKYLRSYMSEHDNFQIRFLCPYKIGNRSVNLRDLLYTLDNIIQYEYIGLTEDFEGALQKIQTILGLEKLELHHKNTTQKKKIDFDDSIIDLLEEYLYYDNMLYRFVKAYFNTPSQ